MSTESNLNLTEAMLNAMTPEEFDDFMDNDIYPERLNHLVSQESSESNEQDDVDSDDIPEDKKEPTTEEELDDTDSASVAVEDDDEADTENDSESTEEKETTSENESKEENTEINYKEIYEQVFQPLKANKREFVPQTAEEVRKLMQQGIDYTKKTQALASKRKFVETLEANEVSEQDLNFLIDIHKKNPEAIKQLLRNNEIDPIELDLEDGTYNPSNHIVSEEYVQGKDVLEYVRNSSHFDKVQEVLKDTWDKRSIDLIKQQPELLLQLTGEFELGRFDNVQDYIEREKLLGISIKSDIERYIELVSDGGKFATVSTTTPSTPVSNNTPVPKVPQGNKAGAKPVRGTSSKPSKPKQVTNEQLDKLPTDEFEKWFDNYLNQKE